MEKTTRHILALAACMVACHAVLQAQTASFLNINPDPVSMGMAGTGTVQEATPFSIWNNAAAPALGRETFQAGAAYSMWQPSFTADNIAAVAGYGRVNRFMTVSAGVRYASHARYDMTDGTTGAVTGTFTPTDIQAGAGVGFKVLPVLSLGAGVSYVYSSIGGPAKGNAVSADFGVLLDLGFIRAGVTASNIGSRISYGGESSYALPASVDAGVGTTMHVGRDDSHAVSVAIQGGMTLNLPSFFAGVGARYIFRDLVHVSVGYHYGDPDRLVTGQYVSAGAGIKICGISVNAAYLVGTSEGSPLDNTFSVGVGYSF